MADTDAAQAAAVRMRALVRAVAPPGASSHLAEVPSVPLTLPAALAQDCRANPPLLTGGLLHSGEALVGVGVDFLTVSVNRAVAGFLLGSTAYREGGVARPGFKSSQLRDCIGGTCWRRWEPRQESKRWGLDYESWEWASSVADYAARQLLGCGIEDVRPSHVDVAFDFSVASSGLTPDAFCEAVRGHYSALGIKDGISGEGGVNTLYIGSKSSERRLRVYRKDLQSAGWASIFGPTLRVELILKGDRAAEWWGSWCESPDDAYRQAAGHVLAMTGLTVVDGAALPPVLSVPDEVHEAERLVAWVRQNAGMLDVCNRAGIDLGVLVLAQVRKQCRMTRYRNRQRVKTLQGLGAQEVTASALSLIRESVDAIREN